MTFKRTKLLPLFAAFICILLAFSGTVEKLWAAGEEESATGDDREEEYRSGGGYAVTGQLENANYAAQIYDATNGLPTSDANTILGDSDGYIWIGGYSGVMRYDGREFLQVTGIEGLTSGRGMFEDSRGRIWVGTNDNGVVMLDGEESRQFTSEDGLLSMSIRNFAEDNIGNIYIGTTAGVCFVDTGLQLHLVDDPRLNTERVLRLTADPSGMIYGQTKNGSVFAIEYGKLTEFYTNENLGMEKVTGILADPRKAGMVYLSTEADVLYYGCFGDGVSRMLRIDVSPVENVHWISYDCGRLWLASTTQIGYLDEEDHFHLLEDLPMDSAIEMMTSDYQGNMWFASSTQGVMKLVTSNFRDISRDYELPEEVTNTTCRMGDMLYIGTDSGLRILDRSMVRVQNDLTDFVGENRVRCVMDDIRGNLWISVFTGNKGLVCRRADGRIISYTEKDGMPSNEIRCTAQAADGSVLVGTNGGLAVIKGGKVTRCFDSSSGIANTVFLTVAEGENGEIYVGTDGDGLYVIEDEGYRKLGREDGLSSDVVMRIRKDEERGLYWVITSNSIEYLKDGKLTKVSSCPISYNYDIYSDSNDNLWVLSSYGLYSVKAKDAIEDSIEEYRLYTLANGLPSIPAAYAYSELTKDGDLYIAGRSGVARINIDHYFEGNTRVKIGVSSVKCDNIRVLPDKNGDYVIPPVSGRIQITPAILDYTMSNPMVHVYLENSDDDGITAQKSKLGDLEFTGLKYGEYILHVQIIDDVNGSVLQDERFSIVKKPQIFELLISKILLGVLLMLIAAFVIWRVMKGTVIRRQYEEIRQARDEAEQANSAKSRFLANMSHEIRTPINTIMGMDEMILREDATNVPKEYFLSVINYALDIQNAAESLLGQVNNLLDMSKIESGKMHLVEREYDVQELLRSVASMIRVRAAEKELSFTMDIDISVPRRLYGDAEKIRQVLLNLLTNAVKYTETGGFVLKLFVEEKDNERCRIRYSVKDSGIGVKAEDMDKLFTAYERLDEEKNSGIIGTGLGLDISRRFAELMGASLRCESVYGEGSEFILTLEQEIVDRTPLGEYSEQDDDRMRGPYVPQFVAPDADILVVDDTPMNLEVIRGLLKPTKVFVTTAQSGEECLEKLKFGTYHVVLLDHMMPGMDGVETLARIREEYPDLPVYALTANATAGEEFYLSKGFNGYLAKPIDSMTLEKTILKHLPENIVMRTEGQDGAGEKEEFPEDMAWLKDVKGIDIKEGIRNSGGISAFLFSVKLFYDTIDGNSEVIEKAYAADDIKLFTIKVHALKTSARIIGDLQLAEAAQKIEDAGNKEDRDYIDKNKEKLMSDYREYKEKLTALEDKPQESAKKELPEGEWKEACDALKELIPQMDHEAVEMVLKQLQEYRLPEKEAGKIKELGEALKRFDWDGMETLIKSF